MPKRMPNLATGQARLAQRLKEKAGAALASQPVAVQPDLVEPDVIEQTVAVVFCPDQIENE